MLPPNESNAPERLLDTKPDRYGNYVVPDGYGLCFRLDRDNGTVVLEQVPDHHCDHIHPNCYAPASLKDVCLLHGGGSGTAVFYGYDTRRKVPMIMKHGGAKDSREVFSLATVTQELLDRTACAPEAARNMQKRIPCFYMLYISPYHLRDRGRELWASIRGTLWSCSSSSAGQFHDSLSSIQSGKISDRSGDTRNIHKVSKVFQSKMNPNVLRESKKHGKRNLRVQISDEEPTVMICVGLASVVFYIPRHYVSKDGASGSMYIVKGTDFLQELKTELVSCQEEENWKVTLAQTEIGGVKPRNGADVLTTQSMNDELLHQLVDEMTRVMRDLRSLATPQERSCIEVVHREVANRQDEDAICSISNTVDRFTGCALRKNFHPTSGRFAYLREIGEKFREGTLYLLDNELLPTELLGKVLRNGCDMLSVFTEPPTSRSALDLMDGSWRSLLDLSTSLTSPSATDGIWSCGLTDAGLHNTFVCMERGLEMFDLGEPCVMPQPAFLTKFLMSFYHTAGMQQGPSLHGEHATWVQRFEIVNRKLKLTQVTSSLLLYLDHCFDVVVDRFLAEVFEKDERVRDLLGRYVVLQLISDSAFCLARWETKGGGVIRKSESSCNLNKWLWRALWDIYVSSHVCQKLGVACK